MSSMVETAVLERTDSVAVAEPVGGDGLQSESQGPTCQDSGFGIPDSATWINPLATKPDGDFSIERNPRLKADPTYIENVLRYLFAGPDRSMSDCCFGLRAFEGKMRGRTLKAIAGFYDSDNLSKFAKDAASISNNYSPEAVCFGLNLLRKTKLAKYNNRFDDSGNATAAKDSDVIRRVNLLVDVDPKRAESGISASDEEKEFAREVAAKVLEYLHIAGWPDPLVSDSGNGYHLIYRVDLPADDGELVKRCLQALGAKFSVAGKCEIDPAVSDASRVCKLYGTMSRKGDSIPDRPHRLSCVIRGPDVREAVSRELLEQLAASAPQQAPPPVNPSAGQRNGAGARPAGADDIRNAAKYISKIKSTSGDGGHDQAYKAAAALVKLNLSPADAIPLLQEWNRTNATPPWSDKELEKKFRDADADPTVIRGSLLNSTTAKGKHSKSKSQPSNSSVSTAAVSGGQISFFHQDFTLDSGDYLPSEAEELAGVDSCYQGSIDEFEADGLTHPNSMFPRFDELSLDYPGQSALAADQIEITTRDFEVNDAALKRLHLCPNLYRREGLLVHCVIDPEPPQQKGITRSGPTPRIIPLTEEVLADSLSRVIRYVEAGKEDYKPKRPPAWHFKFLLACGQYPPEVRVLEGLSTAPVLRHDGSVATESGYDPQTRLLLSIPKGLDCRITESPDREDAIAGAGTLCELVDDFPFASPSHRSAWLAAILTVVGRHLFDGPAPLFMIDANVRGSGKSLLADLISQITTGRDLARMSNDTDDSENRKRITSLVSFGDQLVLIDNVDGALGCPSLDAAITSTRWKDRFLSTNKMIDAPIKITWLASGNNIQLIGDLSRRVAHIRLNSPEQNPENRTDFRFRNIIEHTRGSRGKYLAAALTILAAYLRAGVPGSKSLPGWGSFDGWSGLIRGALVWIGHCDPADTRQELVEASDTESGALAALIEEWPILDPDGQGLSTGEILSRIEGNPQRYENFRDALLEICPAPPGKLPSAKTIGRKLAHFRLRVVNGLAIDFRTGRSKAKKWVIRAAASPSPQNELHELTDDGDLAIQFDPQSLDQQPSTNLNDL